jgi:hypothetical protein
MYYKLFIAILIVFISFFVCAISVIGHLAFDAAHKNKELNRIINSVRKIKVRFSLR